MAVTNARQPSKLLIYGKTAEAFHCLEMSSNFRNVFGKRKKQPGTYNFDQYNTTPRTPLQNCTYLKSKI